MHCSLNGSTKDISKILTLVFVAVALPKLPQNSIKPPGGFLLERGAKKRFTEIWNSCA